MRRLALVPILVLASLLPLNVAAVGLGSIEMNSALNQRLDAEIPLRGIAAERADEIAVGLASERAFRDAGLPRPLFLTHLRFEVIERDGELYVHATSRERITEPFLSFLIEVNAPTGSLRREYTVLLDPPVYATEEAEPETAPEPAVEAEPEPDVTAEPVEPEPEPEPEVAEAVDPAEEPVEEPRRREQRFGDEPVFLQIARERDEAEAERRREAERLAAEEEERRERVEREAAEPELPASYTTERGDTAWDIAARLADGETTVQQMMLALLRYNPEAFDDGNINRLRSGYVLRVPSQDEARAIDARNAIAQVDRQNSLWREWRDDVRRTAAAPADPDDEPVAEMDVVEPEEEPEDELRIVGAANGGEVAADENDAAAPGAAEVQQELQLAREQLESARMEKEELESRVGDLESTVESMERLITVREEQLRALQERLMELAEREGIDLDPEAVADEDLMPDEVAEAVTFEDIDIDVVTVAEMEARIAQAADEREEVLIAEAEAAAVEEEEEDEAVAVADDEAAAVDAGIETVRTQPDEEGWMARILAPLAAIATAAGGAVGGILAGAGAGVPGGSMGLAAAGVVILGLLALLVVRRRQQAAEAAGAEIEPDDDEVVEGFEDLIGEDDDLAVMDEDVDAADADSVLEDAPVEETQEVTRLQQPFSDEDPLAGLDDEADVEEQEKDDTIAEAEVYLAYGLHQQAKDLLTLALQESPRRADYHEKLLETLYSAGEKDEFESQAERFHGIVDADSQGLWKRVVAMGREIAPDNALFRDAADPGISAADIQPAKPAGTDFELDDAGETSEVDLDFSLDEEAGEEPFRDMEATQVDFGDGAAPARTGTADAAGDFDQTVRMTADQAAEAEMAEGLSGLADDAGDPQETGDAARFVGAGQSADGDDDELEFDLGDLEDFAPEEPASDRGGERAGTAGETTGEDEVLEFDLDDFDEPARGAGPAPADDEFDLGADDASPGTAGAGSDVEETALTGSSADDDDFGFDVGDLEPAQGDEETYSAASRAAADSTQEATASAEFDLSDLLADEDAAEQRHAAGTESGTDVEETAIAEFDLDDLDDLGPEPTQRPGGNGNGGSTDEQGDGGDRASGLAAMEETGEGDDELDTMLDLARAYMDMGDHDSATSALEEVIAGGSERQREEAQQLLDSAR